MRFPKLNVRPQSREFIQEFGGLDRRPRISENCFSEMQNLTGDHYPALAPRKRRGIIGTDKKYNAMLTAGDHLAYVEGNTLYWGDVEMELVAGKDVNRQLVMMGAYIVVFPDNMYLNTATKEHDFFDNTFSSQLEKEITFTLCDENDQPIELELICFTYRNEEVCVYQKACEYFIPPNTTENGTKFTTLTGIPNPKTFPNYEITILDGAVEFDYDQDTCYLAVREKDMPSIGGRSLTVSNKETGEKVVHTVEARDEEATLLSTPNGYCLKNGTVYKSYNSSEKVTTRVKIASVLFSSFADYESQKVSVSCQKGDSFVTNYLEGITGKRDAKFTDGAFYVDGCLNSCSTFTTKSGLSETEKFIAIIKAKSFVPVMDYVIESQNRLWGCRYGENANGEIVNEIYASALGNFGEWYINDTVSTDAYSTPVGISGPFTGAVNYRGYPLFFKENAMFKVYGDYPENYQIISDTAMGVQKGCDKSLFVLSNTLYYRSPDGLFAYNGSSSERIDAALGNEHYTDVACCGTGAKLWVSMTGERKDHSGLYVFDTEKGLWHKEDGVKAQQMVRFENDVYIADGDGRLFTVNGSEGVAESGEVRFFAETGVIGYSTPDSKYVSRFALRVAVPHDGSLQIFVEYDSANVWEFKGSIEGNGMGTFTVPVVPRRCDHFRIRLAGKGDCRIFGFSKVLEKGGSV